MFQFIEQICEGCRSSKSVSDRSDKYADCSPTPDLDDGAIQGSRLAVSANDSPRLANAEIDAKVPSDSTLASRDDDVHSTPVITPPCTETDPSTKDEAKTIENFDKVAEDTSVSTSSQAHQHEMSSVSVSSISDLPHESKETEKVEQKSVKAAVAKAKPKRKPKAVAKKKKEGAEESSKTKPKTDKSESEPIAASSIGSRKLEPRDELNWVMGAVPKSDVIDSSSALRREKSSAVGVDRPRLEVLLASGWSAVPQKDADLIFANLADGERKFGIQARGAMYAIDFSNMNAGVQTNSKTGKKRRLRIVTDSPIDAEEVKNPISAPAKANESAHSTLFDTEQQLRYGAQSKRGSAQQYQLSVLDMHPHAKQCFESLARSEDKLCGEWAAFYHSYSFSALIYEVHAALGAVLFRFRSKYAPLPRLIMREFAETPDAAALIERFETRYAESEKDHHPEYRALAISCMCSLVALGPEASPPVVFVAGYSQADLSFRGVLEHLLGSCFVPKPKIKKVASDILELSERSGLDVSQFGGKTCASGKAGHLLQIFIKRSLVDRLVYAAQPWGAVDYERQPISSWLNGDSNTNWGQARILAHPEIFMQANLVRMHVVSADPTFHNNRATFQEELTNLLSVVLAEPELRRSAATALYGGKLPKWWTSEDQRRLSVSRK